MTSYMHRIAHFGVLMTWCTSVPDNITLLETTKTIWWGKIGACNENVPVTSMPVMCICCTYVIVQYEPRQGRTTQVAVLREKNSRAKKNESLI